MRAFLIDLFVRKKENESNYACENEDDDRWPENLPIADVFCSAEITRCCTYVILRIIYIFQVNLMFHVSNYVLVLPPFQTDGRFFFS